jgi:hypothetical protein
MASSVVGADVTPDHPGDVVRILAASAAGAALGQPDVGAQLGVLHAVVAVELGLLCLRELAVGIDAGGVLDLLLAKRHGHRAFALTRVAQRHEGALGAEQAGVHQRPLLKTPDIAA